MKSLNAYQTEYLVVGGFAVAYHGYPRATGDIDIWIARHAVNAEKISATLQEFGFGASDVPAALFVQPNSVFLIGNPPLRVKLLTDISGVDFAACWALRETAVFDNLPVHIIDEQNLKINKKASGRLKDLTDLKYLP